jgi:hypothetical protein
VFVEMAACDRKQMIDEALERETGLSSFTNASRTLNTNDAVGSGGIVFRGK